MNYLYQRLCYNMIFTATHVVTDEQTREARKFIEAMET